MGASEALKTKTAHLTGIYPLPGRPMRKTPDGINRFRLDSRIELELRTDKKENAEHMMLADSARNDG